MKQMRIENVAAVRELTAALRDAMGSRRGRRDQRVRCCHVSSSSFFNFAPFNFASFNFASPFLFALFLHSVSFRFAPFFHFAPAEILFGVGKGAT